MKAAAAFIGPTVWELDGPMPILKMSNTLTDMVAPTDKREFLALVFRHRVAQPHPGIFGEGAARVDVVGRGVVDLVQDDPATGQQGLGALAWAEAPGMEIQAASLHQRLAGAGAGQAQAS